MGKSFDVENTTGKIYANWKVRRRTLTAPGEKMKRPSLGSGAKLLLSLSSIPAFRKFTIRKMREYAWNTAQIRKNLKRLN